MDMRTSRHAALGALIVLLAGCTGDPATTGTAPGAAPSATSGPTGIDPSPVVESPASQAYTSSVSISWGVAASGTLGAADLAAARQELQDYLDTWARSGAARAAQRYLGADQQVTGPDADALTLTGGRVTQLQPYRVDSAEVFTVLATMNLQFAKGARELGHWGTGINSRFVTFTRRAGAAPGEPPYVMAFETGP